MIVFISNYKAIGILGGMGPEATAQFYIEIIRECQKVYGAKYDSDYPEIIIYNLPLPDVVEKLANPSSITGLLQYGLRKLEAAGADFIVAPCNTINVFYREMLRYVSIPVYSIIDETATKVSESGIKKAGILGTLLTLKTGLYDKAFRKLGIETVNPNEREAATISKAILGILEGKKSEEDKRKLLAVIRRMEKAGAQSIVLGCTELPLLLQQREIALPLFDSLKILAEFTVCKASTGRSGVEAAFGSVAQPFCRKRLIKKRRQPEGRVQVPAAALNKNYLSQLRGGNSDG